VPTTTSATRWPPTVCRKERTLLCRRAPRAAPDRLAWQAAHRTRDAIHRTRDHPQSPRAPQRAPPATRRRPSQDRCGGLKIAAAGRAPRHHSPHSHGSNPPTQPLQSQQHPRRCNGDPQQADRGRLAVAVAHRAPCHTSPTRTVPTPRRDPRGPSRSQRSATAAHIRLTADGWPSRPQARAPRPSATRTRPPTPTTPAARTQLDPERGARQTSCAAADAALATRWASSPDDRPAAPVSSARGAATAAAAAASEGPRRWTDLVFRTAAPSRLSLGLCRGVTSVLDLKTLPSGKKSHCMPTVSCSLPCYPMYREKRSPRSRKMSAVRSLRKRSHCAGF